MDTSEEAVSAAKKIGGDKWVIKAQVHAGGRGKAGGVKLVSSEEEIKEFLGFNPKSNNEGEYTKRLTDNSMLRIETTKKGRFWRKPGYIGFRSANAFHRVDLEPGTKPMTIFIPGPFGLRKGPRSEYGIDFKTKRS